MVPIARLARKSFPPSPQEKCFFAFQKFYPALTGVIFFLKLTGNKRILHVLCVHAAFYKIKSMCFRLTREKETTGIIRLVAIGWWLVAGGYWLAASGSWLVAGGEVAVGVL